MKRATEKPPRGALVGGSPFAASLTLRQVRYFIAVAEAGKIGAAAKMVGITPSAVTEAVAQLEDLSGAPLFTRHPRGLTLTYEGHRFLAHARNILSAVDTATSSFIRPENEIDGELTVAASVTVMSYFLTPILARFRRAFPNIKVRVTESGRGKIERALLEKNFDLAVMLTSNLDNRTDLLSHVLVHSKRRLWLPSQHYFMSKSSVSLDEVAGQPYIQLTIDDAERSTKMYWRDQSSRPNTIIRTQSVEAVRSLVAHGQGVTILSDMMYRPWSLEGDRIQVRELSNSIPTLDTGLVWSRDAGLSPTAQTFVDFCRVEQDAGRLDLRRSLPISLD